MSYVIKIPPYIKKGVVAEILQVAQSMGVFPQETPIHRLYTEHPEGLAMNIYLGIRKSSLSLGGIGAGAVDSGDIVLDITEVLKDE